MGVKRRNTVPCDITKDPRLSCKGCWSDCAGGRGTYGSNPLGRGRRSTYDNLVGTDVNVPASRKTCSVDLLSPLCAHLSASSATDTSIPCGRLESGADMADKCLTGFSETVSPSETTGCGVRSTTPGPRAAHDHEACPATGGGPGATKASDAKHRYSYGPIIGVGTFSVVKVATDLTSGHRVAVKIIPLTDVTQAELSREVPADLAHLRTPALAREGDSACSTREEVMNEVRLLRRLSHDGILRLIDVSEEGGRIHLVTEMLEGGELLRALLDRGSYAEEDARDIFRQLLQALEYMHEQGIVHRDVKLEVCSLLLHLPKLLIHLFLHSAALFTKKDLLHAAYVDFFVARTSITRRAHARRAHT